MKDKDSPRTSHGTAKKSLEHAKMATPISVLAKSNTLHKYATKNGIKALFKISIGFFIPVFGTQDSLKNDLGVFKTCLNMGCCNICQCLEGAKCLAECLKPIYPLRPASEVIVPLCLHKQGRNCNPSQKKFANYSRKVCLIWPQIHAPIC